MFAASTMITWPLTARRRYLLRSATIGFAATIIAIASMRAIILSICFALFAPTALAQSVAINVPTGERAYTSGSQYIVLHSGETVVGSVDVFPSKGVPEYAVANGARYELRQIRAYGTSNGEYAVAAGSRNRPMLLVKRESGRISIYESTGAADGATAYMQVDDGQLSIMTSANLRSAMAGHADAMHHMNRERRYGNVGIGAMMAGTAIVVTGAIVEFGNIEGPSGVVIAGTGVLFAVAVNAIVPGLQSRARQDAVRAYNR